MGGAPQSTLSATALKQRLGRQMADRATRTTALVIIGVVLAMAAAALLNALAILVNPLWGIFALVVTAIFTIALAVARVRGHRVLLLLLSLNVLVTDIGLVTIQSTQVEVHPQIIAKLAVYFVGAAMAALFLRSRALDWRTLLLLCYSGLCVLSAAYAPSPFFSFSAAAVQAAQVLLVIAVAHQTSTAEDLSHVWDTVFWTLLAKTLISWAIFFIDPEFALLAQNPFYPASGLWRLPRFGGLAGPNITALNAAVLAVLAVSRLTHVGKHEIRSRYTTVLFVALLTLIACQSRSGLVAAFVGCAMVMAMRSRRAVLFGSLAAVAGVVALWWGGTGDLLRATSRTGREEEVVTMAGRTEIWRFVLSKVKQSPIMGFGFGSGRILIAEMPVLGSQRRFQSAHNFALEAMLNTGIIGLSMLLLVFASTIRDYVAVVRRRSRDAKVRIAALGGMGVTVACLMNGFAESGVAGSQTIQVILVFLLFLHAGTVKHAASVASDPSTP